nr:MAG TPA: hypothetical protein [Caudoviricetes sp.]
MKLKVSLLKSKELLKNLTLIKVRFFFLFN